jgi:hypothetical protein
MDQIGKRAWGFQHFRSGMDGTRMQIPRENTVIHDDSGHLEATRSDVSARDLVASGPNKSTLRGSVEDMLAVALARASEAGRWDIVGQLARELEARRLASAGVVQLDATRGKESG